MSDAVVWLLRDRGSCEALSFLLEDEGVDVRHVPVVEGLVPPSVAGLRAAAEQAGRLGVVAADASEAAWVVSSVAPPAPGALRWLVPDARTAATVERLGWSAQVANDLAHLPHHPSVHHAHGSSAALVDALAGDTEGELFLFHRAGAPLGWLSVGAESRVRIVPVLAWQPPVDGPASHAPPRVVVVDAPAEADAVVDRQLFRGARILAVGRRAEQVLRAGGVEVGAVVTRGAADAVFDGVMALLR